MGKYEITHRTPQLTHYILKREHWRPMNQPQITTCDRCGWVAELYSYDGWLLCAGCLNELGVEVDEE